MTPVDWTKARQPIDWANLVAPTPPWAHLVVCAEHDIDNAVSLYEWNGAKQHKTLIRFIRAQYCRNWENNFIYWSAALQFPGWAKPYYLAFRDCIKDLPRLRASVYIFVVTNADLLLIEEGEDALAEFLELLNNAASYWSQPLKMPNASSVARQMYERDETPFHVLFQCNSGLQDQVQDRYARAKVQLQRVPFESRV